MRLSGARSPLSGALRLEWCITTHHSTDNAPLNPGVGYHGDPRRLAGERRAEAGLLDAPVAVLLAVDQDDRHPVGVLVAPVTVGVHVEFVVAEPQLGVQLLQEG